MQKIVPALWFDHQAKEAAEFYIAVFSGSGRSSKIISASPLVAVWELEGQRFMGINGGPAHAGFTETVSFLVNCETQDEVDYFWEKLTADGGRPSRCGWLKDKFGLSWQIVPTALGRLMSDPDKEKTKRVMDALLKMGKLEIAGLNAAYEGRG